MTYARADNEKISYEKTPLEESEMIGCWGFYCEMFWRARGRLFTLLFFDLFHLFLVFLKNFHSFFLIVFYSFNSSNFLSFIFISFIFISAVCICSISLLFKKAIVGGMKCTDEDLFLLDRSGKKNSLSRRQKATINNRQLLKKYFH